MTHDPDTDCALELVPWQHDVFISYRRVDASGAARTLRDRLLRYKLPPHFQLESTRKLSVFVDTVYERADADFFEGTIKPSLRGSKYLLVLATPQALANSANEKSWLVREIEYFLTLPQGRNVIIALIEGEFGSPLPAGLEKLFPNIEVLDFRDLRKAMLWRPSNSRVNAEIVKLVATLHGVPHSRMPELHNEEQRWAAARSRRLAMIFATLACVFGALAVVALLQTRLAHQRQLEAEVESARVHLGEARRLGQSTDTAAAAIHALAKSLRGGVPRNTQDLNSLIAETLEQPAGLPLSPLRHGGDLRNVQFSRDGEMVATTSKDNSARLWAVRTGAPRSQPLRHGGWALSPDFSPDGSLLLTGSTDGKLRIWDTRSGELKFALNNEGREVWHANFSPQGDRIVTMAGGEARLWDVATGRQIPPGFMHWGVLSNADFSPDGMRLLTWAHIMGNGARIWDLSRQDIPAHERERRLDADLEFEAEKRVAAAQFSLDSRRVLTASDLGIRVWDASTGGAIGQPMLHEAPVTSAVFSPDGRRVASGDESGIVRVWNAWSGAPLTKPMANGVPVSKVAFISEHRLMVLTTHAVNVWDTTTETLVATRFSSDAIIWDAALSANGRLIASAGSDQTARIFLASNAGTQSARLQHADFVESVALSPDGTKVVTGSRDKTARVWDARTGKRLSRAFQHSQAVQDVVFSPSGHLIATTSIDGIVRIWNSTSFALTATLKHEGTAWGVSFTADESVVAVATDRGAWLWNLPAASHLAGPFHGDQLVWQARISRDGSRLLTASTKGARLWAVRTGDPIGNSMSPESNIKSITFDAAERRILTASDDGSARVWDALTAKAMDIVMRHDSAVNDAAFSPDGSVIITGSEDHSARLWDAGSGRLLAPPLKHTASVDTVRFSGDGRRVITGSFDNSARVWDVATGHPVSRPFNHENRVIEAVLNEDGSLAVTGSYDGLARVWAVTNYIPEADHLAEVLDALNACDDNTIAEADRCVASSRETLGPLVDDIKDDDVRRRVKYHLLGDPGSHPLLRGTPFENDLPALRGFLANDVDALRFWWDATGSADLGAATLLAEAKHPTGEILRGLPQRIALLEKETLSTSAKDDIALAKLHLAKAGSLRLTTSVYVLSGERITSKWDAAGNAPLVSLDARSYQTHSRPLFDRDVLDHVASHSSADFSRSVQILATAGFSKSDAEQAFLSISASRNINSEAAFMTSILVGGNLVGDPDPSLADAFQNQAAEAGSAPAQVAEADELLEIDGPSEVAIVRVRDWLGLQCARGYPPACDTMGEVVSRLEMNQIAARKWYEKAIDLGSKNGRPERHLAALHELGLGAPHSLSLAFALYLRSANKENSDSLLDVALRLEQGIGTPINENEARKWYEKSAAGGEVRAMYRLGQLATSSREARNWLLMAAMEGHPAAHYALATLLLHSETPSRSDKALAELLLNRLIHSGENASRSSEVSDLQWLAGEARMLLSACSAGCTASSPTPRASSAP